MGPDGARWGPMGNDQLALLARIYLTESVNRYIMTPVNAEERSRARTSEGDAGGIDVGLQIRRKRAAMR